MCVLRESSSFGGFAQILEAFTSKRLTMYSYNNWYVRINLEWTGLHKLQNSGRRMRTRCRGFSQGPHPCVVLLLVLDMARGCCTSNILFYAFRAATKILRSIPCQSLCPTSFIFISTVRRHVVFGRPLVFLQGWNALLFCMVTSVFSFWSTWQSTSGPEYQ